MAKQIIKTTLLKGLRPLFNNSTESIQRYHDINTFFADTKDYMLFAEPTVTPNTSEDSIDWQTDFEGEYKPYRQLSNEDKKIAKGILKRQLNRMWNAAYYYTKDPKNRNRILSILDDAIEIPDIDNVFLLRDDHNKTQVVITCWGFIGEAFNAPTGIIKDLIPVKVKDILFEFVYPNNKPAKDEEVHFNFMGKDRALKTDKNGHINIFDLPFDTEMEIYQEENKSGEKVNINELVCGKENTYRIKLNRTDIPPTMQFVVKDKEGNTLASESIVFYYKNSAKTLKSGPSGTIEIEDIEPGAKVHCYQEAYNKRFNKHSFTFDAEDDYYEIVLTESAEDFLKDKLIVLNQKDKPVHKAKLKLSLGEQLIKKRSNKQGIAPIWELEHGDHFEVTAKKGFYKSKQNFTLTAGREEYIVKLKTGVPMWFWIALLLFILAGMFLVWWFFIREEKPPVPKSGVTFTVVDSLSNKPIENAILVLTNEKLKIENTRVTNNKGKVEFQSMKESTEHAYILNISAKNYEKLQKEIFIKPGSPKDRTIKLLSLDDGGLKGQTGDLKINLKWFTKDDLDLYVYDPCNNKIYYHNRKAKCKGKTGELDLDANGSTAPVITKEPQENIFWKKAANGIYSVFIQNNRSRTGYSVRYIVTVKNKNKKTRYKGTLVKKGKLKPVTTFTFRK